MIKRANGKASGKAIAKASVDPYSFGNVLVERKLITEIDLCRALAYQRENRDVMLGEALVRIGALSKEHVEAMLLRQDALREPTPRKVGKLVELAATKTEAYKDEIKGIQARLLAFNGGKP